MSKKGVKKVSSGKRSISKKQNNSKKQKEALPYKNVVIPFALAVVAVVVFLLVILIKQPTAFEEGVPTAGKAVSSNLDTSTKINLDSLADGTLAINPSSANAAMQYGINSWDVGETFTVDVAGNPNTNLISYPNPRFNNYEFTITYDSTFLKFLSAKNLITNFDNNQFSAVEQFIGTITIYGEGTDKNAHTYGINGNNFVELKFETKGIQLSLSGTKITPSAFKNVNAYGPSQTSVTIINTYGDLDLKIGYRVFEDKDGDTYGNSDISKSKIFLNLNIPTTETIIKGDCDDDNTGDALTCPTDPNNCVPSSSKCAICINPGVVTDECDGVDNNCDQGTNDETKPKCDDQNLKYECGIHSVCQGSSFLDCNNPELDDFQKCNKLNKDVCSKGKCVLLQGGQQLCAVSNDVFTPACGEDGDGDNDYCDPYENMLTCPKDCTTCPIQQDCTTPDNDNDGLSDDYEDYLNTSMGKNAPASVGSWYDKNKKDSDNDEVLDGEDFCPGTDNPKDNNGNPQYTVSNGRINFNGCYSGDVGTQNQGVRPDGCFNLKDTTFSLNYYAGSGTCDSYLKK